MSLYALKPRFQALLRPMTHALFRAGITANEVTIATLVVSLLLGAWLAYHVDSVITFVTLPVWLFVRMALNAIDGMLAREHGQTTTLGAWLNEIGDIVADLALYLPFALLPAVNAPLVAVVMLLGVASEVAGIAGSRCGGRRNDGPMGKADRAFVFGTLGLTIGAGVPAGPWVNWVMAAVALALIATIVRRTGGAESQAARPTLR